MEGSNLRHGFTTGACAAAAAKAATKTLLGFAGQQAEVDIPFPNGERHCLPVAYVRRFANAACGAVRKDAGDDPDVTHGSLVLAYVEWTPGDDIVFVAGDGVGTVTKKGLTVPPGQPAINPGPRKMIRSALQELTDRAIRVTISIPGGQELADRTYNPRLGIKGGLSILGTTGRVRPFSLRALRCSLMCGLDVAKATGVTAPVLTPGHIGEHSARKHLCVTEEQVLEVGNEWGFLLDRLSRYPFRQVLIWGHPGKLAKLTEGQWDTHSSRSGSAIDVVQRLAKSLSLPDTSGHATTEGLFAALDQVEQKRLAEAIGAAIIRAVRKKTAGACEISVGLVNMAGGILGTYGDLSQWKTLDHTG